MTNTFTLDDLNAAIEAKYAPLVFQAGDQEFVLQSLMRVDKKVREAVAEKLDALNTDDDNVDLSEDETLDAVKFVVSSVTKDRKGAGLLKVLGDDLLKYMEVVKRWSEATQPGEAQDSPS